MFSKFTQTTPSGILSVLLLVCSFISNAQTPIPGHAGKVINGASGALLSNPNAVFVSGNYAYIASSSSNALEIIDISNPANPIHSGSITDGTGGALLNNPVSVFVSGNYAYVASAGSNALEIVDVTDRTNPVHFSSLIDGAGGAVLNSPAAVYVSGNTAYVVSSISNSLEIVDVTIPSAPTHLGSIVDGTGGALLNNPSSVFVINTLAYITSAGSNALEIIDVTDPTIPLHKGSLSDGAGGALLNAPASLFVSGSNAYVASAGSNAIEIVDVTNPATPIHKSSLSNGGSIILSSPQSIYLFGNYAYVASKASDGLEIIDVTNPSTPQHQTSISNGVGGAILASPTSVVISGSSAFVTSSLGNALEVITLFTPLAPTATAASSISENGFTVNWTGVSNATSFEVDVSTDNFATFVSGYNGATANGTSLIVSGLTGCTNYQFRVRGVNANGTSTNSNVVFVTTGATTPIASSASAQSQTGFTANWNSISCATGYYLDVATDSGFLSILSSYNNLLVNGTSQGITGLSAGVTYYYRVRSSNASGTSSNSNTISTVTIPANPTATLPNTFSQTGFTANWNSVTGASAYDLDVATDSGFGSIIASFNAISQTSKAVTGLSAGTTYYYQVRSSNTSGTSSNSNVVSAITIPADPTATTASSVTQNSFVANWNSVAGANGYNLDVATDAAFTSILSSYNNLLVNGTSQNVTGLAAGVNYYYRVRSENTSGTSTNSNSISVITIPAGPTATAASTITQNGFTANWNSVTGASGYDLDVATDVAFASTLASYNNLSVSGTSQNVTGLSAGTSYYYRVRSKNTSGVSSSSNVISLQTNQSIITQAIPLLSGGTLKSYSMFSIPLVLQNTDSTINTIFGSLGNYTPDKWRLLRWNSTANNWDENKNGISTIDRGKSYWFNSVDPISISVTGTAFNKSSFALHLNSGWNQIGSPYNFDVSWADVLAQNASVAGVSLVETSLYKYVSSSQSFVQTDNLKAWSGGFVFNGGSAITLKIPITVAHATGRMSATFNNNFSNAGDWFLPLKLSADNIENDYSGIGMNAEASSSYDKFDGITVPRFLKYLEFNSYHRDFFEPYFARDVVATSKSYNWHFIAESNLENQNAILSWDNQSLINSDKQLILFDPATGSVVDMKQSNHYNFKIQDKHPLHFFYASDKESLKPDVTSLAAAYPNPVSATVTFPLFIANAGELARIEIYDSTGKIIKSIGNRNYEPGLHMEQWDCTDSQGSPVSAGMYIYRFVGGNNLVQTGKLIVK